MDMHTTDADARRIIRAEYGDSENFVTPEPVGYVLVGRVPDGSAVAAEVSRGRFLGRTVYGVSFALRRPDGSTARLHELSEAYSGEDARADAERLLQHVADSLDGVDAVPEAVERAAL